MLDAAMSEDGFVAPMTAAADGEIIDGSARLERAAERFAGVPPIVIKHDGTRPIIAVRTDIPSADTPQARRIALRANRIAEVDLGWDADVLRGLAPGEVVGLWTDDELASLISAFDADGVDAPMLADGDRAPFRQMTFTVHDEQFEEVESAIKAAKAQGGAVSAVNENSNGNALAWICRAFNGRTDG